MATRRTVPKYRPAPVGPMMTGVEFYVDENEVSNRIWAPFPYDENKGRYVIFTRIFFMSMFLELLYMAVLTFGLTMLVALVVNNTLGTLAGGLAVGAGAALLYGYTTGRQSSKVPLPRHLNPARTFGEWVQGNVGVFALLFYFIAQAAGSLGGTGLAVWLQTAAGLTSNISASQVPAGGFALNPWVATFFVFLGSLLIGFAQFQEETLDDDKRDYQPTRNNKQLIVAIVTFFVVAVHYHFGLWRFNPMLFLFPDIWVGGGYGGVDWAIELFTPLLGYGIAAVLTFFTWNLNLLSRRELKERSDHRRVQVDNDDAYDGDGIQQKMRVPKFARATTGRRRNN